MRIARRYSVEGRSPYDGVTFRTVFRAARDDSLLAGQDEGRADSAVVPAGWSEEACETLIRECLADGGVPVRTRPVPDDGVPQVLWPREADGEALARLNEARCHQAETDARQMFDRVAGALAHHGWQAGYFDGERDARAFFDELRAMMCRQVATPDIGVLRNAGLGWAYGIRACDTVSFVTDFRTGAVRRADIGDMPASGAVIHGVTADLAAEGGPMDLWRREADGLARGLPAGMNLSALGTGGGLMDHLAIGECAARAFSAARCDGGPARLVTVDADHPEAARFAAEPEAAGERAAASATGARLARRHLEAIIGACLSASGPRRVNADDNPALRFALVAAREAMVPWPTVERLLGLIAEGRDLAELRAFAGLRCARAAGAQSRYAVRGGDDMIEAAASGRDTRSLHLLDAVARSAAHAGGAGLMFAGTADAWNPCPAGGVLRAAAADGGYLFLDDTGCARAHLNLEAFVAPTGVLDVDALAHAAHLWTIALDISIGITAHATPRLAARTWEYRPVGLNLSNLAGALMALGLAYDSDAGRALGAGAAALVSAAAWQGSAAMAGEMGPFPAFVRNRKAVLRCVRNHARAASGAEGGYEQLGWAPVPLRPDADGHVALARDAGRAWAAAADGATANGVRNAQLTQVAPDRAAMRLLDAPAPGLEPVDQVTTLETVTGGGFCRSVSARVPAALRVLGYGKSRIADILRFITGHGTLSEAPGVNHASLRRLGFGEASLRAIEAALPGTFDIRFVFSKWTLGETFCLRVLGLDAAEFARDDFDLLNALGFSDAAVDAANAYCFGAPEFTHAPHLTPDHRAVFDDARRIPPAARIRMMAAIQPFVSGGVGHELPMPAGSAAEDCRAAFLLAWRMGLKHLVLARDENAAGNALDSGWAQAEAMFPSLAPRRAHAAQEPLRARFSVIAGGRAKDADAPPPAAAPLGRLMSQALALAHTARDVAPRDPGARGDRTVIRTCIASAADGAEGGAEASRCLASETPRSGASVPSETGVPVEQRQV